MRGRKKRERQDHSACRATQEEKEELKDWVVQKEEAGVDSLTMLLFEKKSPSENASAVNFVEISLRVQMSAVEKESKRARDTTGTGV